ncbi:MAG: DEAD/DEAH box helicase [Alphaproteobacteria bacterium]
MTTFADLGLSDDILRAIQDVGYTTPTPIQEQAIPYILMTRDLLGCAQTGTGKTASFVLPMLEVLGKGRARARMPRSLILEPTRELAAQVAENFEIYGKYHKLSMALLIGGTTMDEQIRNLDRGVDVLIATPGRMLDLHERGKIMLNDIKIFVIDEADRMLDMGFIPDVEKIGGLLPPIRQTLFFSATMPPEIRKLADRFLSNPKTVTVAPPATTSENIKQIFISIPTNDGWQKREALRMLLKRENVQNAFIFCNRKRDVAMLHKSLIKHGFNAGALHGDMEQSERTETLDKFKRNEITLLVCSDVAARGLDVDNMSHVFNFDVPFGADDYVHRIGRTGRAGRSGTAYTFITPEEDKLVAAVESLIKKKIDRETLADLPAPQPMARRGHQANPGGGRHQHRQNQRHNRSHHANSQPQTRDTTSPAQRQDNNRATPPKDDHDVNALPAFLRRPVTTKGS